jgi:hypothetical protein
MLFALMAKNDAVIDPLVKAQFADNHIKVGPGQWILSSDGNPTSKEVWDRLVGEATPTGIIVAVSGYYGRADTSVWEWVASKRNAAQS